MLVPGPWGILLFHVILPLVCAVSAVVGLFREWPWIVVLLSALVAVKLPAEIVIQAWRDHRWTRRLEVQLNRLGPMKKKTPHEGTKQKKQTQREKRRRRGSS